jgi:hypothetical protein
MKFAALLLFVLVSSTAAQAETLIADYESVPGESLDSFVVRLAPELRKQTADRNAEVCGALGPRKRPRTSKQLRQSPGGCRPGSPSCQPAARGTG